MKREGRIKGAIFDVDGVLLDSMGIWRDLGARYLLSQGKRPEEGLSGVLFSMSMEQGAGYLKGRYLPEMSEEEIGEGLEAMLSDFYLYEVQAKAGAAELLKGLSDAGMIICAASSSPRALIEPALLRNGLSSFIGRIFTSAEIGSSKHSPEIYDAAAAFMGCAPGEIVVFEDSLYALQTAKRAGYYTAGVLDEKGEPGQKALKEQARIYLRSLGELDPGSL